MESKQQIQDKILSDYANYLEQKKLNEIIIAYGEKYRELINLKLFFKIKNLKEVKATEIKENVIKINNLEFQLEKLEKDYIKLKNA